MTDRKPRPVVTIDELSRQVAEDRAREAAKPPIGLDPVRVAREKERRKNGPLAAKPGRLNVSGKRKLK